MYIDSKTGMINGLRGLTVLVTLIASGIGMYFTQNMPDESSSGIDPKLLSSIIVIAVAVILIVILQVIINRYNKNLIKKRKDNEHNYAIKYVCPECKVSFRGKIYENILAERACPRCKSVYFDKNEQH